MDRLEPLEVLRRYYEHRNRHETAAAEAYLAKSLEIQFVDGPTLNRQQVADAGGWDVGARGSVEWTVVETDGDRVVIRGTETNEFLRLLAIPPIRFDSTFWFDDEGLITRQRYRADWGDVSLPDALEPAVAWAREHAPDELEKVYPGGKMVYTEDAARRWVALLTRWRQAVD